MATIRITYFGVDGEGPTVKAAREDAGRKIEEMTKRSPACYSWRGHTLVILPSPDGSCYILAMPDASEGRQECIHGCLSWDDAILSGLRHMWHNGRTEGDYILPDWMARAMGRESAKQTIDDARRNDAFQRAYRAAPAGDDAHSWACDHTAKYLEAIPA